MPNFLRAIALAVVFVAGTASAEPVKQWELAGFETPESVLPDAEAGIAYVSNVAGKPTDKDGNGFISKITLDGKMENLRWVEGLDAPKGLALVGDRLFVADIDKLVEIDTASGEITATYDAPGAVFLNDVAADEDGRVYVSDMRANTIWRLADGKFEPWLESEDLKSPNGLLIEGDKLIVAAWGIGEGDKTKVPGNLVQVSLANKSVSDLGSGKPIGNLDGIEPAPGGTYYVTDWVAGGLYLIQATGDAGLLIDLNAGSADLGIVPTENLLLIPLMNDGKVVAYRIK